MKLRSMLVRSLAVLLFGLPWLAGCGGGSEETGPAEEPNVGFNMPAGGTGKPPGAAKGESKESATAKKAPEKKAAEK